MDNVVKWQLNLLNILQSDCKQEIEALCLHYSQDYLSTKLEHYFIYFINSLGIVKQLFYLSTAPYFNYQISFWVGFK